MKTIVVLTAWMGLVAAMGGCGDRAEQIGKPCKQNSDCDTGVLRGVCMTSVMSGGYCSMLCDSDADCKKPGFVCGDAKITTKGTFTKSTTDAKYCRKK